MDETFEIYFHNLTEETQTELLAYFGLKAPEEMNWDVFPLVILSRDNMTDE